MLRWLCAVVVGATLSAFTFLLVTGDYISDGPVLVAVSKSHGIHSGDVFVIAGWAVAMVALFLLARHPGRLHRS